jgi:predicted neutral ceramidase superfamily lipid hydrolase
MIGSRKSHWKMRSLTSSPVLTAQEPTKATFDVTSFFNSMISYVNLSSSLNLSLLQYFLEVPYATHPRKMHKNGFIIFILCSFLTIALAATDCEILNSGISTISSTACCTETAGIVCINGRVKEM